MSSLVVDQETPVAYDTLLLKPETQGEYKSGTGNRMIRLYIPPHVDYFLPAESYLNYSVQFSGRGRPIFTRSAACNSLWQSCRVSNGSNTHELENITEWNSYCAQVMQATLSESKAAERSTFMGYQANMSADNNLFWENSQSWYSGSGITQTDTAKTVQIVQNMMASHLLSCSDFIPNGLLGGLRCEFLLDDFQRSLQYTTGNLGMEFSGGLPSSLNFPLATNDIPASGSHTEIRQLTKPFTSAGAGFTNNSFHAFTASPSGAVGTLKVLTTTSGVVQECEIYAVGTVAPDVSNTKTVLPGDEITVQAPSGGQIFKATVPNNVCIATRKLNADVEFEIRIPGTTSGQNSVFGNGTVKSPYRVIPGFNTTSNTVFPQAINPWSIGDRVFINNHKNNKEQALGLITGFTKVGNEFVVRYCPNIEVTVVGTSNHPLLQHPYAIEEISSTPREGIRFYCKSADRIGNGWTGGEHLSNKYSAAIAASSETVGYTLRDVQFQCKRVFMPPKIADAQMNASMSGSGLQLDIPTVITQLVNVANIHGPVSSLIATPNLRRALAVLSLPLNQTSQRDLTTDAFQGHADSAEAYQYLVGAMAEQPVREAVLNRYSLSNPRVETQAVSELIKTYESHGFPVMNLQAQLNSFVIGRAFSRRDMSFDLYESGDLSLKIRYSVSAELSKLFVHFVAHVKSVLISSAGFQVSN